MRKTWVALATALVVAAVAGGCGGQSGVQCGANLSVCGQACVDTGSDPANCGECGAPCAAHAACVDGVCVFAVGSSSGVAPDGGKASGSSSGAGSSAFDSGASRPDTGIDAGAESGGPSVCSSGLTFCGGVCVDSRNDSDNCGGCGIVCATGQACSGGSCVAIGSTWPTLGGDILHSGFNAVETGKPPLTMAWSQKLSAALWPAVSDGAAIYVSSTATLEALSPADGHVLWAYNFGSVFSIGQPTVADGHVFIAQCNNTPGTYMYSFVASTGMIFWSQPFSAQWEHFWAPLVVAGRVYFDGGEYGGLYALSESSGGQIFFENEDQWDSWSPTYVHGAVYTFTNGNVRAFDPVGGSLVQSTTVPWIWTGYTMNTSPISDGASLYLISPPNLYAFAPGLGSPLWTANGAYSGQPAVANGVVYSISGGQLRANDASTGAQLWTFAGDSSLKYPPAVAAGFVYVASDANVYALDVAQHTQAWTATPGGWLSIAGGRLLVAEQNGTLAAWSLSQ